MCSWIVIKHIGFSVWNTAYKSHHLKHMQPKTILKALGAVFDECLEFIHWLLHENSKRFSTYLPNLRISYDSTFHLAKVWSYWSKTRGVANQCAFFFCGLDSVPETNVRKLENVTAHSAYLISKKNLNRSLRFNQYNFRPVCYKA